MPYASDYTEANRLILSAAMFICPTGKEQKAFVDIANIDEDPAIVTRELLSGLLDGLKFGNWPKEKDG